MMKTTIFLPLAVLLAVYIKINHGSKIINPICRIRKVVEKDGSFKLGNSASKPPAGYPSAGIKAALAKDVAASKQMKAKASPTAIKEKGDAVAVKRGWFHSSKRCPHTTQYLWGAYGCWVVWPRIRTVRCLTRRCSLGGWPKRKGVCRRSHRVTYPRVLLACRKSWFWVLKWRSITVATKCSCYRC